MEDSEFTTWLEIEPGERFVRYGDIAHRLAEALHPTRAKDDSLSYGFTRVQFDQELEAAVQAGTLAPRNALTKGKHTFPHGAALNDAEISLQDLRAFATERDIGVRVRGAQPAPTPAVPITEQAQALSTAAMKEAREDDRLAHCEAMGIVFEKSSLLRLPNGITKAAEGLQPPITRQSLAADLKAALTRRFEKQRNGER